MTAAGERVLEQALDLSDEERAELAAILADSVGDGATQAQLDAAWRTECRRRLERADAATLVAADEVDDELDDLLASASTPVAE